MVCGGYKEVTGEAQRTLQKVGRINHHFGLRVRFNLPPTIAPIPTSMGPGHLDHDRNARDEAARFGDNLEIGKSTERGEDEGEVEELDKTTADGPLVSGVASGLPIGSAR